MLVSVKLQQGLWMWNCPYQGYLSSVTGLICSPQHRLPRIHSKTFQFSFQPPFLFSLALHKEEYAYMLLFISLNITGPSLTPLNVTLIQPAIPVRTLKQFNKLLALWCQLIGSSLCSGWCGRSAVEWQWTQIPEKGHQLSSCSLTAVSVLFCFPDIDLL